MMESAFMKEFLSTMMLISFRNEKLYFKLFEKSSRPVWVLICQLECFTKLNGKLITNLETQYLLDLFR